MDVHPPPRSTRKAFCTIKKKNRKKRKNWNDRKNRKYRKKTKKDNQKTLAETFPPLFCFFLFFGLRLLRKYFWKNAFHYRPLVFTFTQRKRRFPKIFRQFILNFFHWRPDFFESEVAPKKESSIWTNRLSVKQDFVYKEEGIIWTELVRWGLPLKKKCCLERKWIIRKNVY